MLLLTANVSNCGWQPLAIWKWSANCSARVAKSGFPSGNFLCFYVETID